MILNGKNHIFDSFECAIKALAPICPHCGTQVVGHGEQQSDAVSKLSDAELDDVVKLLKVRHEQNDDPEMAELPSAWQRLPSGAPAPNWVAALDEARQGR